MGGKEFCGGDGFVDAVCDFVGAKTGFAFFAFDEWVGKSAGVAGGLPSFRVHNDGGVDAVDVITIFDEKFPPSVGKIFFEGGAKWTKIPSAGHAAVDIATLKNEAATFAQTHNIF